MSQAARGLTALIVSFALIAPGSAADFTSALICAARLMGEPVPKTQITAFNDVPRATLDALCKVRQPCGGAFVATGPRTALVFLGEPAWRLQVHEACHAIQHQRDGRYFGPAAERECEAVQRRADDCLR